MEKKNKRLALYLFLSFVSLSSSLSAFSFWKVKEEKKDLVAANEPTKNVVAQPRCVPSSFEKGGSQKKPQQAAKVAIASKSDPAVAKKSQACTASPLKAIPSKPIATTSSSQNATQADMQAKPVISAVKVVPAAAMNESTGPQGKIEVERKWDKKEEKLEKKQAELQEKAEKKKEELKQGLEKKQELLQKKTEEFQQKAEKKGDELKSGLEKKQEQLFKKGEELQKKGEQKLQELQQNIEKKEGKLEQQSEDLKMKSERLEKTQKGLYSERKMEESQAEGSLQPDEIEAETGHVPPVPSILTTPPTRPQQTVSLEIPESSSLCQPIVLLLSVQPTGQAVAEKAAVQSEVADQGTRQPIIIPIHIQLNTPASEIKLAPSAVHP